MAKCRFFNFPYGSFRLVSKNGPFTYICLLPNKCRPYGETQDLYSPSVVSKSRWTSPKIIVKQSGTMPRSP